MSIWLLVLYAICMLAAMVGFSGEMPYSELAMVFFVATLAVFVAGVVSRGIRRPVV